MTITGRKIVIRQSSVCCCCRTTDRIVTGVDAAQVLWSEATAFGISGSAVTRSIWASLFLFLLAFVVARFALREPNDTSYGYGGGAAAGLLVINLVWIFALRGAELTLMVDVGAGTGGLTSMSGSHAVVVAVPRSLAEKSMTSVLAAATGSGTTLATEAVKAWRGRTATFDCRKTSITEDGTFSTTRPCNCCFCGCSSTTFAGMLHSKLLAMSASTPQTTNLVLLSILIAGATAALAALQEDLREPVIAVGGVLVLGLLVTFICSEMFIVPGALGQTGIASSLGLGSGGVPFGLGTRTAGNNATPHLQSMIDIFTSHLDKVEPMEARAGATAVMP
jgi:hypothetical protein